MGEDELKILIEVAFDLEKSLTNMTAQMEQLRQKFKDYQIKITAGLNQAASAAQIKHDLKRLSTAKNHVKLVGKVDRDATNAEVSAALKRLKNTQIKISGVLDDAATAENVKKQLERISDVKAKADVEVTGAEQVDSLTEKMDKAGSTATGMAANLYLARTALNALRQAAQEAKQMVVELDEAATDLALVTGESSTEAYNLLEEYNALAKQLGAVTTEVSDAATEWLRQGKTAAETATLIEQSMILSKVGAMEAETATKNLTSAMKGYGLAVEDVSGIVDKLTAIDLKAAVTASDLAVAMSRTASSANISGVGMDRLLGYLATVEEVTQKSAETIGESFKTIFARMGNIKLGNYLDDDGEDLSDVETVLKSFGIALRDAEGDFRDFGAVLDDVYSQWEQFGSIDKRAIANAFAGTRQQENFIVLMENYGKALEYAGVAANSAGTSLEKFAAYEDSVEAKAASFTAAIESLTMDTVDPELVKDLIDAGTAVVEFAEKAGLLKATLLSLGAGATMKGVKMLADGFSAAKQSVLNLGTAINTLKDVQDITDLSGDTIKSLGNLTKGLSDEQLKLVLTSRQLSDAQMEAILMASGLSAQESRQKLETLGLAASQKTASGTTWSLSAAMTGLGASIKAAFAANPIGVLMLGVSALVSVVSLLANAWESVKQRSEEARNAMSEAADAANTQRESLASLIDEYKKLVTAGDFDASSRETAKRIQSDITDLVGQQADNLDLVNGKLDEQIAKLDSIALQNAYDSRNALDTKYRDAEREYAAGIEASGSGTNFLGVVVDEAPINQILREIGYVNEAWENASGQIDLSYTLAGKNASEVLAAYKELQSILLDNDSWQSLADDQWRGWIGVDSQDILNSVQSQIELYADIVEEYQTSQRNFLENEAAIEFGEMLKGTDIDSQGAFDDYIEFVQSSTDYSEAYKAALLDVARNAFPEFSGAAGATADVLSDSGAITKEELTSLTGLKEKMSELDGIYSLISAAQKEMYESGGISADTIASLSEITEDYTDYLDIENDKIRINIDALRELANSKLEPDLNALRSEIAMLEEQNVLLKKKADRYLEQRSVASDGGAWNEMYVEATEQIEENNRRIEENLSLLGLYGSILDPWADTLSSVDSFTSAMEKLGEIQAALADGFTISAAKAREFAESYPEILEAATVAADGQISLNADVVNAFLAGKESELKGSIDAEVAKLEAEKAVLTAKMESAQAQLELVRNIGEGEGQITRDLAEYRINAGNAVAQAMIDAGVDEATAFRLAATAMAQNAEEFNRVAMEVCTDINGNFNSAAYNLAQTMYQNLTNVKTDLASVALQAQDTARAIQGIASGKVQGATNVRGGSAGGYAGGEADLNVASGSFAGHDYNYTAKFDSLDDFVSKLELDISEYSDAIATIDSQIALLESLKGTSIKDYLPETSRSSSSKKEVEEYTATIDNYREALERLNEARKETAKVEYAIENSDNLREQIALQRELMACYAKEQEALHNLNNLRDNTINASVASLRELGFVVKYNADTNALWIENMEHLNELTATSKGEYDTLQEATNALRKETEDLINSITDLNDKNKKSSEEWWELENSIKGAREEIDALLEQVVKEASDAVDSIQDVYDTLHQAADEYAESGYITVDTIQEILSLGVEYIAYLRDENGQLVINEERIRDVIAARTEQLAIESSLMYIESLRIAQENGDIATLNNLLYATEQTTDATWGLVYANLALLNLSGEQYNAALNNINSLRALADSAVQSIGQASGGMTEELETMQSGLTDILDYVMDVLKHRVEEQIDALEGMKDAYSEIIDLKKESLEASKEEAGHQKTMASKMRELAKLQAKIDALSLDDSREAQAERAALLEEMALLQEDLSDTQADRTLDTQKDALDKLEEAYHDEKDKEIEILEDSISSKQKLYSAAISYIETNWSTLKNELIQWNYEVGNTLEESLVSAWDAAYAAAQRYGSFTAALNNVGADVEAAQSAGSNLTVGNTGNYDNAYTNEEMIHAIIKEMYANAQSWHSADDSQRQALNERNAYLGTQLAMYGVNAHRKADGVWYVGAEKLFEKYKNYIYHDGGIVGGGDIKSNEQIALLKDEEWVLSEKMVDTLKTQMKRIASLHQAMADMPSSISRTIFGDKLRLDGSGTINNVTTNNSNQPIEISFGDTIIHGADNSTVQKHVEVNRDMVNQIARLLRIKM